MNPSSTRLHFHEDATALRFDGGDNVTLPIGPAGLARDALRHDPPTPAELERAIDLVEDALTRSRLAQGARGELVTADPVLLVLPGLDVPGASLTRHEVEALFQSMAPRALGMPASAARSPHVRELAAAIIILRECMYHLGFDRIRTSARTKPELDGPRGCRESRELVIARVLNVAKHALPAGRVHV